MSVLRPEATSAQRRGSWPFLGLDSCCVTLPPPDRQPGVRRSSWCRGARQDRAQRVPDTTGSASWVHLKSSPCLTPLSPSKSPGGRSGWSSPRQAPQTQKGQCLAQHSKPVAEAGPRASGLAWPSSEEAGWKMTRLVSSRRGGGGDRLGEKIGTY